MDTRQLEVFITAAQYLNFTKASKQLNMVPSAVSHSISMLENELDKKLFKRDNNKLTLTKSGEAFLMDAIRVLTIVNNAMIRTKAEEQKENLQIGFVYPEFILEYVPLISDFSKEHANINITGSQHDSVTLSALLSEKKIDVAFARHEMFSRDNRIHWVKLYRDPFLVVLHKTHELASEERLTIPMLKNETIIVMNRRINPGMFDMIQHLFMSHNIVPHLNDDSDHHITSLMYTVMQKGIVIVPRLNISYLNLPDDLVCVELDDQKAYHEIGIAWNDENLSKPVSLFLDQFKVEH